MCVILLGPARDIPREHVRTAIEDNPDGWGVAVSLPDRVEVTRGSGWDVEGALAALDAAGERMTLLHARWATHGSVCPENTHPFDAGGGHVAAHNGVLSVTRRGDETDSEAWIRRYLRPVLTQRGGLALHASRWIRRCERRARGSRIAILGPGGRYRIIGESLGFWLGGVWYSNRGPLVPNQTFTRLYSPTRVFREPPYPAGADPYLGWQDDCEPWARGYPASGAAPVIAPAPASEAELVETTRRPLRSRLTAWFPRWREGNDDDTEGV